MSDLVANKNKMDSAFEVHSITFGVPALLLSIFADDAKPMGRSAITNAMLGTFAILVEGDAHYTAQGRTLGLGRHCPQGAACSQTTSICGTCFDDDVAEDINFGYVGAHVARLIGWLPDLIWTAGDMAAIAKWGQADTPFAHAAWRAGADLLDSWDGKSKDAFCGALNKHAEGMKRRPGCSPCSERGGMR